MFFSNAAIIIIAASGWFTFVPEAAHPESRTLSASYMTDTNNNAWDLSLTGDKSIVDFAYQAPATDFFGVRFGASAMLNARGTFMIGPGVGKTVSAKGLDFTLFVYPSFSSVSAEDQVRAISGSFNFRTTFDVAYPMRKGKIGLGYMHISNGGYQKPNRGIEALRLSFSRDF